MKPEPTIFMGSDSFSLPVLQALVERGAQLVPPVEVAAVVTQPDRAAGRGLRSVAAPIASWAREADINVLQPERLRSPDAVDALRQFEPGLIVVAAYGQILPSAVLDLPIHGCLNLHPSLLPLYRGPSPVVGALLEGDAVTGTTLMLMTERMDAGPIVSQIEVAVREGETGGELERRLAHLSADLLIESLQGWLANELRPADQDERLATYTSKVTKRDGLLDWMLPADLLVRRVRAYNPWPAAYTYWGASMLRILQADAVGGDADPGQVLGAQRGFMVGTGAGLLRVEKVQPAGGRQMTAEEFLRGHDTLVGARLGGDAS